MQTAGGPKNSRRGNMATIRRGAWMALGDFESCKMVISGTSGNREYQENEDSGINRSDDFWGKTLAGKCADNK